MKTLCTFREHKVKEQIIPEHPTFAIRFTDFLITFYCVQKSSIVYKAVFSRQ